MAKAHERGPSPPWEWGTTSYSRWRLSAFDAASGRPTWEFDPVARELTLRAVDALDGDSGGPVWSADLAGQALAEPERGPLIQAGERGVFVGLEDALVAFDAASGTARFRSEGSGGRIWLGYLNPSWR